MDNNVSVHSFLYLLVFIIIPKPVAFHPKLIFVFTYLFAKLEKMSIKLLVSFVIVHGKAFLMDKYTIFFIIMFLMQNLSREILCFPLGPSKKNFF